jgi:heavy metal sensor kinase
MFNSIKIKLIVWFLVIFTVVFAGLEVYLYHELKSVVINLVDDHLKNSNQALANLLTIEEGHGQLESELVELSMTATGPYTEALSGHYYQIVSLTGEVLTRSPSLGLAEVNLPIVLDAPKEPVFETVIGPNSEPVRLISQKVEFVTATLLFQHGETLEHTYQLVASFRKIVIIIFPVTFAVLCSLGLFIITGWAFRPLKKFSEKISHITEESLGDRIEEKELPKELKPFAGSFNTMLGRIEGAFSKQKQFLSDASHELRTPTSIIKSFCEVTLGRERKADQYKEAIGKIGNTVNRMCDIINRILVISRMDSKTIHFKPARIDLKEMVKDVMRLMESSAENKGVKISLDGGNVCVRGDREGMTEVFTNIVENAIKYNKEGGRVEIHIGAENGSGSVTVTDTGIGIAPDETERIFDRFYRVDESRGVTVGSGLGLSIVRTIVEAHGGTVEVKSEPGVGTTFKIQMPLYV